MEASPVYLHHKGWVDSLVTTPSPCRFPSVYHRRRLLTSLSTSPEHVLRGTKSFAVRSLRSRPAATANTFRVPSDSSNKENQSTAGTSDCIHPVSSGINLSLPPSNNNSNTLPNGEAVTHHPLGPISPNNQTLRAGSYLYRRSPTPSLRKKRAEAIVKAHGSPTHVRVTAGGRIVPKDQSPLCFPRFGYSAVKVNNGLIKFAPNHPTGKSQQWAQATTTTTDGMLAQDPQGTLCQIVNGHVLPLVEIDGTLRLHMPAPNLSVTQAGPPFLQPWQQRHLSTTQVANFHSVAPPQVSIQNGPLPDEPSLTQQVGALELEYSKLEHELKELDKTEVLHGRSMGKVAKDALVGKRRELITTMDKVRKAIKGLKGQPQHKGSSQGGRVHQEFQPQNHVSNIHGQYNQNNPDLEQLPLQMPTFSQPWFSSGVQPQPTFESLGPYGFNSMVPQQGIFMPPPSFDGSMATPFPPYNEALAKAMAHPPVFGMSSSTELPPKSPCLPQSDGSLSKKHSQDLQLPKSPRSSRALPIKAPEDPQIVLPKTRLNPKSPEYTPGKSRAIRVSQLNLSGITDSDDMSKKKLSPLPATEIDSENGKLAQSSATIGPIKRRDYTERSTTSSYHTSDFFPRDTSQYSLRKHATDDGMGGPPEKENIDPERDYRSITSTTSRRSGQRLVLEENTDSEEKGAKTPSAPPGTPVDVAAAINSDDLNKTSKLTPELAHLQPNGPFVRLPNFSSCPDVDKIEDTQNTGDKMEGSAQTPSRYYECNEDNTDVRSVIESDGRSHDWLEGFHAGLSRRRISPDRAGDYVNGYCNGLLQSKPAKIQSRQTTDVDPATGSPTKSAVRRSSPTATMSSHSSSRLQSDRRQAVLARPALEVAGNAENPLKQAMMAPQNENAILTPAEDGPRVDKVPFRHVDYNRVSNSSAYSDITERMMRSLSLGDGNAGFPFTSQSFTRRDDRSLETNNTGIDPLENKTQKHPDQFHEDKHSTAASKQSLEVNSNRHDSATPTTAQLQHTSNTNRISSVNSVDPNIYIRTGRGYPPYRMFSPQSDMRSLTSISRAAGMASTAFTPHLNPQMDGVSQPSHPSNSTTYQSQRSSNQRYYQPSISPTGRFKEASSLDGMSPSPPSMTFRSPPMSPRSQTPAIDDGARRRGTKSPSPAKQKFEQLAGAMGLRRENSTSATGNRSNEGSEPNSPQQPGSGGGKRRWRDIWRSGRAGAT